MSMSAKLAAAALSGFLALTGCGGTNGWETSYGDVVPPEAASNWRINSVEVIVPETLTVSEENSYAPDADIVWRGDPPGDRHAQVDEILTEAVKKGATGLKGSQPVNLVIEVVTFHAVTEKTRYGLENAGVHNITFTAQVVDARTGAPLTPKDTIRADLIAFSGDEALAAEARGETQRKRIVNHVANVIAGWLGVGSDVRGSFMRAGR